MNHTQAMNHTQVSETASSAQGPLAKTLWHLPLIFAGLIAAYELEIGHLAIAGLAAGLLVAFQARMDKADGTRATNTRLSKLARGDGGSRAASEPLIMRGAGRSVLDGGSLEHRQRELKST
ncbi:hypothetical protein G3480_05630 [Thiorhodococcus mannitoliphagus]|uniref:Uncharacterized protein n=1 Tax=Thiorhodococcus mannitoliphagus TaxID=329406 RepID=A0A6P1DNI2_9GAMM|nr:hypothetical protein [Thiorhodococcus mannitoliphagus]NEX19797.1 hypothetical protein [Thiorhodococcus mannitoliphagus]